MEQRSQTYDQDHGSDQKARLTYAPGKKGGANESLHSQRDVYLAIRRRIDSGKIRQQQNQQENCPPPLLQPGGLRGQQGNDGKHGHQIGTEVARARVEGGDPWSLGGSASGPDDKTVADQKQIADDDGAGKPIPCFLIAKRFTPSQKKMAGKMISCLISLKLKEKSAAQNRPITARKA